MAEKIVEGRMAKFYEEVCLYEQPFIKDNTITIEQLIEDKIAKLGENITVSALRPLQGGRRGRAADDLPRNNEAGVKLPWPDTSASC